DKLEVLTRLEPVRGRGAGRRAGVAAAPEPQQMALGILPHTDGFPDSVAGNDQAENLFGHLKLRCRLLERSLLGERSLLFRTRSLCSTAATLSVDGGAQ